MRDVPASPSADRIHSLNQIKRRNVTPAGSHVTTPWAYQFDGSGNLVSKLPSLPIIGDLTSGSSTISSVSAGDIAQLYVGAPVAHAALPSGTTVSTISSTSFTVNHAATGNVTAASITLVGQATTYSWDEDNRLVEVGLPGSITVSYEYDSAGRMLTKTHSVNGTTRYEWDGWSIVREYGPSTTGSAVYDSAHCDTDHYGWTGTTNYYVLNGVLMGVDFDGGGTNAVVADAMGHVRALVDPGGSTVFSASYSAYGEAVNVTDSTPGGAFALRYVGQYGVRSDADTGLHYMRQRWADLAGLQRFVSMDSMPSENRYSYVDNAPLSYADPHGLWRVHESLLTVTKPSKNKAFHNVGDWLGRCVQKAIQALQGALEGLTRSGHADDPIFVGPAIRPAINKALAYLGKDWFSIGAGPDAGAPSGGYSYTVIPSNAADDHASAEGRRRFGAIGFSESQLKAFSRAGCDKHVLDVCAGIVVHETLHWALSGLSWHDRYNEWDKQEDWIHSVMNAYFPHEMYR